MDKSCLQILEKCVPSLSTTEKAALLVTSSVDLQWIADKASTVWSAGKYIFSVIIKSKISSSLILVFILVGSQEDGSAKASTMSLKNSSSLDVWTTCLFNFLKKDILITQCPSAVIQAWPVVYHRLHTLFSVIDPTYVFYYLQKKIPMNFWYIY